MLPPLTIFVTVVNVMLSTALTVAVPTFEASAVAVEAVSATAVTAAVPPYAGRIPVDADAASRVTPLLVV